MKPEEFLSDARIKISYKKNFGDFADAALPGTVQYYEWESNGGYLADPAEAGSYGVNLSTFREWSERHKDEVEIDNHNTEPTAGDAVV